MSRNFILFLSVTGLMIVIFHMIFAQSDGESNEATVKRIVERERERERTRVKESIETLSEISQKIEVPIIVKMVVEKQGVVQEVDVFPPMYRAYVQKYHFELKKNPASRLAIFEGDMWTFSVENPEWKSENNSVHGVEFYAIPNHVFYLFVHDANHQFLAWMMDKDIVQFKNIAVPQDKKTLLEDGINHSGSTTGIYRLKIRSDLYAELKDVGIDRMEIVEITSSDWDDMMSMQVKLRGPKSGDIYVYTPVNPVKEWRDALVPPPKPEEITPSTIMWKQREIIKNVE